MIKGICFDLDGVYFLNGKSNFIKNIQEFGVSEDEAKRVFLKSPEMTKYKKGKMTDEEYWSWALNEWQLDLSINQIIDILIKGYEVNDQAAEYVKKVRESGYKTLICTNNFPARINGLHKRFGFLNNFDASVFSYEIGYTKPQTEIYMELIKRAQLEPNQIFYADDDEINIESAKNLGINTLLYTDFKGFIESLRSLGVKI